MAETFGWFSDSGLTTALTLKSLLHSDTGSTDPLEFAVYLGSNTASVKIEDSTAPGTNQVSVYPVNLTAEWVASTAYSLNDIVKSTSATKNGYYFKCTTAGTSGTAEPTWDTTIGNTTNDNTAVWTNQGKIHEITEVKLATTQGGLAGATGGAALNLGTSVLSGTGSAQVVWLGVTDGTDVAGTMTELRIRTSNVIETAQ